MAILVLLPLLGLLALRISPVRAQYTSPVVYPSRSGAGNWYIAYRLAHALVSQMTLAELNNVTYGISDSSTGCGGVSGGVPRLGFPGLCLNDAGNGVRNTDFVNGYAAAVSIGASWNASLAYQRAVFMGAEFKAKGVNVALGPVVGPLGRIAEGGRNWEGFGADPYLDGILGGLTVNGMQQSVITSVKHYLAYEQETSRKPIAGLSGIIPSTSANVDDTTMHEVYLWPFQDLVHAGAGCIMCSYNRINNTYACENSKTLNGLLKGELNFQGFVLTDFGAQHSGIAAADAGLDMAMPSSSYWDNGQLADAVNLGLLNKTRLVDMATRIVATWYQFGQNDASYPKLGVGMPPNLLAPHTPVNARDPAANPSLLEQAIEGHVLVKNTNGALPLNKPLQLSVFGYDAITENSYTPGSIQFDATFSFNLFQFGLQTSTLNAAQLAQIAINAPPTDPPETAEGTLTAGGGSGSNTPAYISSPYDALQQQAYLDGTSIFSDFVSTTPNVAADSDACLVFVNELASEAWDRPGLADPNSDSLISNVASKCNNTIVVIHNAGIRLVDAWIENPNVTAVIFAHLPGQDAGRAVVQILYGQVSPSGRLPYTVAKLPSDYGTLLGPCKDTDILSPQCDFSEGVSIDYRGFLARGIAPRYEFGYGLTYSSFGYSGLKVNVNPSTSASKNATVGVGGLSSLFESVGTVQATIQNTGSVAAAEVAQLYLQIPGANTRALRGFQKVFLQPGESAEVTFNLRQKDVSSWSALMQSWTVPSGTFAVSVGRSVLDLPLSGSFSAS